MQYKKRYKITFVHASVSPEMQEGASATDAERFLALENTVRELSVRVKYFEEWHGVDKAWGDDFSTFQSRISALELKMSSLQAPSKLERKSSSLAVFTKYLTIFAWIKEVQRRAGEETMAERRLRHQQREKMKKSWFPCGFVGKPRPYEPPPTPYKKIESRKVHSKGSKGGKTPFEKNKNHDMHVNPHVERTKTKPARAWGKCGVVM